MVGIAFFERQPRIPFRQSLGLGVGERDEPAAQAAQVGSPVTRGAQVPAKVRAHRNGNLHGSNAALVVAVGVRFRNERKVGRARCRREDGEPSSHRVERRAVVQERRLVHHRWKCHAGNLRKSFARFLDGHERAVFPVRVHALGRRDPAIRPVVEGHHQGPKQRVVTSRPAHRVLADAFGRRSGRKPRRTRVRVARGEDWD